MFLLVSKFQVTIIILNDTNIYLNKIVIKTYQVIK